MRGPRLLLRSKIRGHYFSAKVRARLLIMADGLEVAGKISQANGLRAKVAEAELTSKRRRAKTMSDSFREYYSICR